MRGISDRVGDEVGDGVGDEVGDGVGDGVGDRVGDGVGCNLAFDLRVFFDTLHSYDVSLHFTGHSHHYVQCSGYLGQSTH